MKPESLFKIEEKDLIENNIFHIIKDEHRKHHSNPDSDIWARSATYKILMALSEEQYKVSLKNITLEEFIKKY